MSSLKLITVIVSAMFLLIEGIYMRFAGLYFMVGALLVMPFISYAVACLSVRSLRCARVCPSYVGEGESVPVTVMVLGRKAGLGPIEVDDTLPEWIERTEEGAVLLSDQMTATYTLKANKRGVYRLGPLGLRISDPLGFFVFTVRQSDEFNLVVLPDPLEVLGMDVASSGSLNEFVVGTPIGMARKGSGLDFHGVREYQPGDELRRVHWASTARHGRLDVIEFEHTPAPDVVIAMELRQGSEVGVGKYTSLEYAAKIAAWIAQRVMEDGGTVRLAGVEEGLSSMPSNGMDHLYAIKEVLARVKADHKFTLSESIAKEIDSIERGSIVICLVPTLNDDLAECVDLLNSRSIDTRILRIALPTIPSDSISDYSPYGKSLAVIECSDNSTACRVAYEYSM